MTDKKEDSKTDNKNIVSQLTMIAKALRANFTLKGEPIAADKVFSPTGLLPALLRRADQLCSFCLGYGLGVTFERSDTAMLGVIVEFDNDTPASLRLLCVIDVIIEIMQQGPSMSETPVDALMLD